MTKGIFWGKSNVIILDRTSDAMNEYGHRFGSDKIVLTKEHIKALQAGKMLAWNDSEYSTFVTLDTEND